MTSSPNFLFTRNNGQCGGADRLPVLATDWSPQGNTFSHHVKLPGIDLTAGQFVIAHLRGEADKKGLPRLGTDESVKEDLFTVAFQWLTSGVDPAVMEIASLISALEKQGKKIPPIGNYGRSTRRNKALLGSLA